MQLLLRALLLLLVSSRVAQGSECAPGAACSSGNVLLQKKQHVLDKVELDDERDDSDDDPVSEAGLSGEVQELLTAISTDPEGIQVLEALEHHGVTENQIQKLATECVLKMMASGSTNIADVLPSNELSNLLVEDGFNTEQINDLMPHLDKLGDLLKKVHLTHVSASLLARLAAKDDHVASPDASLAGKADEAPPPRRRRRRATAAPTTVPPTTEAPTTVAPTTVAPTTVAPTTAAPATEAPPPPAPPAQPVPVPKDVPAPSSSPDTGAMATECQNTNNGATDKERSTCEVYEAYPAECGQYDDDDFTAGTMCCACKASATR